MATKARYLVALAQRPDAGALSGVARARLEEDARIVRAAKNRVRYERDDRWWAVVAGVLVVAVSILYSANLETAGNVAFWILCAYIVAIFTYILIKRALLKRTDPPISPTRALEALYRRALDLPARANDAARLYDDSAVAGFSRALAAFLVPLAREAGVEPSAWEVAVETNPRLVEGADGDVISMPAVATVAAVSESGARAEFLLEQFPTFAVSPGGDAIVCDPAPRILGAAAREPRLREDALSLLAWTTLESGERVTERYRAASAKAE